MQQHGPWKIKKRVVKYKNPWIEVHEDEVMRPDGKPGIFGSITMKPGISVLALDEQGFVYLTKEFYYAIGKEGFGTVSGGIDKGESPLTAAKRELREEIGAKARQWISLGMVDPFTMSVNSPAYIFLAKGLTFMKTQHEGTEKIETVKVRLDEAVTMVMQSKITHAQSCVLILKAKEYLDRQKKVV